MPDQGVDIRIRTRGGRQAAAEAKLVGRADQGARS
jgi:hypothetical protein